MSTSANSARNKRPPQRLEHTSSTSAAYGTSLSGDPAPQGGNPGEDDQHTEAGDDPGIQLQRGPRQVGTLEHDVSKSVDRVRERQHVRDVLQRLRLGRDREEDA